MSFWKSSSSPFVEFITVQLHTGPAFTLLPSFEIRNSREERVSTLEPIFLSIFEDDWQDTSATQLLVELHLVVMNIKESLLV